MELTLTGLILIPEFPSSTPSAAAASYQDYEDAKYELPRLTPEENQQRQEAAREFLGAELNDLFENRNKLSISLGSA